MSRVKFTTDSAADIPADSRKSWTFRYFPSHRHGG